jgi:hypothetical protein
MSYPRKRESREWWRKNAFPEDSMRKTLIYLFCFAGICLLGQGMPFGVELQINTFTSGNQNGHQVASLPNGGFAVCWSSDVQDGSGDGVYGQMFSPVGGKIGREFRVNTTTEGHQTMPQISSLTNGSFVVCWRNYGLDGFDREVCGQVFTSDGMKINQEFDIATSKDNSVRYPQIRSLSNGDFVVCWLRFGQDSNNIVISGQVFSPEGSKTGQEFLIDTYTETYDPLYRMISLPNSGFVVCWWSEGQDGDGWGVYGQLFSSDGSKIGQTFLVNTYTNGDQKDAQIVSLTNGNFVVSWHSSYGRDGSHWGIYGQQFDSDGRKIGQEFRVNASSGGHQWYSQITALPDGGFVVNWGDFSDFRIHGQLFSSNGEKIGQELAINDSGEGNSAYSKINLLPNGGFVVCWMSDIENFSLSGVFGRLFNSDGIKMYREFTIKAYSEGYNGAQQITSLPDGSYVVSWESTNQDYRGWDLYAKRFPESPLNHTLKPFKLIGPANDRSIETLPPSLIWQQPSDHALNYPCELHYKIYMDETPDFLRPNIFEQDQDTTLAPPYLVPGTTYFWKVLASNIAGDSLWSINTNAFFVVYDTTSGAVSENPHRSGGFILHRNYPNPFNSSTILRFDLMVFCHADISIYDISGKWVGSLIHESRLAGNYFVQWDGRNSSGNPVPSGIYVCRMEARTVDGRRFTQSVKMGLVR